MNCDDHAKFLCACRKLAEARQLFNSLAKQQLISGNDNHIGDIGEYWVSRYFEVVKFDRPKRAPNKVSRFDLELSDGTKISVKTRTNWAKRGRGTQVKPASEGKWILAAVSLNDELMLDKLAIVPFDELQKFLPFPDKKVCPNEKKPRFPVFRWWSFLQKYERRLDWVQKLSQP